VRVAVLVAMLGLAGCGRLAFDPLSGSHDGGADGGDSGITPCTSFGPWSSPTALTALNTPTGEFGPSPSPDGLELYFQSDRVGSSGSDIYVASRVSRMAPFGNITPVTVLNTSGNDQNPAFTPDGLTMFFTSDRSAGIFRIYRTTRSAVGAAWAAPTLVSELSSFSLLGPMLTKQSTELFATVGPIASAHLETATFDGTTFSPPAVIPEFGTTPPRGWSGISPDGLMLAYEGQRSVYEIMYVTRSAIGATWSAEAPFVETNDGNANEDVEWSYDGTELYWASNRLDVAGNTFDMFVMTRSCL